MGVLLDVVIEAITNKVVSRISNLSTVPQPKLIPLVKGTFVVAVSNV